MSLLPPGWVTSSIEDVMEAIIDYRGKTPTKTDSGIPLITAKIIKSGRIAEPTEFISYETYSTWMRRGFPRKGDVLITTEAPLGEVAQLESEKVALAQRVILLRGIPEKLDNFYLKHVLQSRFVQDQLRVRATGTTVLGIKQSELRKVLLPLPRMEEQRRIAAILDKADAVRRKRKEAIALTEELLRSSFLDMFGDPVTNPKGWEVVELCELLTFITTGSRGWAKFYASEGRLFLRIQNVKDGKLLLEDVAYVDPPDSAEARRTRVQEGDVLLSMTADLGRTAVIPRGLKPAHINQHLAILRLNQKFISPFYLAAFLSSVGGQLQIAKLNREGVKAGLNFDDVKSLHILLPPINTQKRYEEFCRHQTDISSQYKRSYDAAQNLFNCLLQRAFRGEL